MATNKYLDKAGLKEVLEKLKEKFAGIEALVLQGSVANVASLPSLSDAGMRAGLLYIIESADQTNVNFIEGAGKKIDPYSEVVTINTGTAESPVYKWCFLGSVFTVKDKVSFGTAFPTAPFNGQAFLYVGEDKYTYSQVPSPTDTDDPAVLGWFVNKGSGVYEPATEHAPEKVEILGNVVVTPYYIREDVAIKGGIYKWNETDSKWVSVSGTERMDSITEAEIDDLFSIFWP